MPLDRVDGGADGFVVGGEGDGHAPAREVAAREQRGAMQVAGRMQQALPAGPPLPAARTAAAETLYDVDSWLDGLGAPPPAMPQPTDPWATPNRQPAFAPCTPSSNLTAAEAAAAALFDDM